MPIGATLAAAAATAGAAVYSSSQQKKAADQAIQANDRATQQQIAAQQAALDRVTQLQAPFQQGGAIGMQALLARLGLGPQYGAYGAPPRPANTQPTTYNDRAIALPPGVTMTAPKGGAAPTAGARDGNPANGPGLGPAAVGSITPLTGFPQTYNQNFTPTPMADGGDTFGDGAPGTLSGGSPGGGSPMGAAGSQGAADWAAYLQAYPDVAKEAQRVTADGEFPSAEAYAQWHFQNYGQNEGRQVTYQPATPSPTQTGFDGPPPQPSGPQTLNPDGSNGDLLGATRPDQPGVPTLTRPDQGTAPSFTRPDQPNAPAYQAPDTGSAPTFGPAPSADQFLSGNLFHTDPGYEFALSQGLRAANAGYAARGLLKSDAAAKGINDYAQGMADQQYGNWWNRQNQLYGTALGQFNTDRNVGLGQFNTDRASKLNQFNTDRSTGLTQFNLDRSNLNNNFESDRGYGTNLFLTNRANDNQNFENDRQYGTNLALNQRDYNNTNFNADRAFQANRYDTATGNLFSLAQIGQNAAGAVGGANQSYANNAGNIFGAQANAQADAAQQRAQANAGMVGSLAGAASNLFNAYQGGTRPFSVQTVGNAYPVYTGGVQPIMPNGPLTTFNPPRF